MTATIPDAPRPSVTPSPGPWSRPWSPTPSPCASRCAGAGGARLVDAGAAARGSVEAGRRIAEICLGGLGTVSLAPAGPVAAWPLTVVVHSADPVLACLGSQYAGWSLAGGEGSDFFALGSGPGRAAAAVVEALFEELRYRDEAGGSRSCSNPPARRRRRSWPRWRGPRGSRPAT